MEFFKKLIQYMKTKRFLKIVGMLFLVYFLIITITMFYLDSYTNHGQKIEVPNLIGKNVLSIESLLEESELTYEILDSIYDPKKTEGTIISQDPQPTFLSRLFVKEDRIIKLRVSKKTLKVEMPSLIDKSRRFAESILKNRGLKFTVSYRNTVEANGAILDQLYKGKYIKEGTKIPIGATIAIVVGRNEGGLPVPIPDLYGLTIFEAKERLASIPGMIFFPVCNECQTYEDSLVARINSQTPEFMEGIMIPAGSTITVNAVLNFVDERPEVPQ